MSAASIPHPHQSAPVRAAALASVIPVVLAGACAAALPLTLFYRLILVHFYVRGAVLLDSGLLASLMWHSPISLPMPESLGGSSFFAIHVAPLLLAISALSRILPLSMPQLFAGFIGVWLLVDGFRLDRGRNLIMAALAASAFACNGLAVSIVLMPHFELFGAACLILFLCALTLRRIRLASIWFALALATREDVGLHAFGFLATWIAYNWWRGVPWQQTRRLAAFAIASLAYAVTVLLWQHRMFPGTSSFVRIYLGWPPFSHIGLHLIAMRLAGWTVFHSAILVSLIATAWWAARVGNAAPLLGYMACLPWALLHLLAASVLAGLMAGYYAYPFLIAMAWPWLAAVDPTAPPALRPRGALPAWALLGLSLVTMVVPELAWNPGRMQLSQAFLEVPSAEQQRLTDRSIDDIVSARPTLGRLVVDQSVASLAPRAFSHAEIAGWNKGPADTVVYLENGYDAASLRGLPDLPTHVAVAGTTLRIRTNRPAQGWNDSVVCIRVAGNAKFGLTELVYSQSRYFTHDLHSGATWPSAD